MRPAWRYLEAHSRSPWHGAQQNPTSTEWICIARGSGKARGDGSLISSWPCHLQGLQHHVHARDVTSLPRSLSPSSLVGAGWDPLLRASSGVGEASRSGEGTGADWGLWILQVGALPRCWAAWRDAGRIPLFAAKRVERDAIQKVLLNTIVRFPLSFLWFCISSENKRGWIGYWRLYFSPKVILPGPGADPERPHGSCPNPGPGWQWRQLQHLRDAPWRRVEQFAARSCCGVGSDCIFWHKGKKIIKLGFPLFYFIVSFWTKLWAFPRKILNHSIKSSNHKATHSTASECSLLLCCYKVLSLSLAQFHLGSLFSELNPNPANNVCLPPPQCRIAWNSWNVLLVFAVKPLANGQGSCYFHLC